MDIVARQLPFANTANWPRPRQAFHRRGLCGQRARRPRGGEVKAGSRQTHSQNKTLGV